MEDIERPEPVGTAKNGFPLYDPAEVAAYRKALGVSQSDLADVLDTAQSFVSILENPIHRGFELDEYTAKPMLDGAERIARNEDKLRAKGLAELAAIRRARSAGASAVVPRIRERRIDRVSK